jgi:hypothetical protein
VRIAWFAPVTGHDPVIAYSRTVLSAMAELGAPLLCCNSPPERFPPGVPVVDVVAAPQDLPDLGSFDALFYVLGNVLDQHAWIFEMTRTHPGIVVLRDLTLHPFFRDYYLEHLRRPDLYVTRMAEQYGVEGLAAAHRVLGPWFDPGDARVDDRGLLRYTFTEEALRSARGAVVHSRGHAAFVRQRWPGPICEAQLPAQDASASPAPAVTEIARTYAQDLLRFVEQRVPCGVDPLFEAESRIFAQQIATQVGETLGSLGATTRSPGVEAVIAETARFLSPRSGSSDARGVLLSIDRPCQDPPG